MKCRNKNPIDEPQWLSVFINFIKRWKQQSYDYNYCTMFIKYLNALQ